MDYINSTIEHIQQENKFCSFMGHFSTDSERFLTVKAGQAFLLLTNQ